MATLGQLAKSQRNQPKKANQGGRIKAFFKGVWSELKKVHWPSKKQLASYTGVVIVTVLVMAIAISVFDWVISSLIELVLGLS